MCHSMAIQPSKRRCDMKDLMVKETYQVLRAFMRYSVEARRWIKQSPTLPTSTLTILLLQIAQRSKRTFQTRSYLS